MLGFLVSECGESFLAVVFDCVVFVFYHGVDLFEGIFVWHLTYPPKIAFLASAEWSGNLICFTFLAEVCWTILFIN